MTDVAMSTKLIPILMSRYAVEDDDDDNDGGKYLVSVKCKQKEGEVKEQGSE